MIWALAVGAVVIGAMVFPRLAPIPSPMDVDPVTQPIPERPNAWLVRPEAGNAAAPIYALSADRLAETLRETIERDPRIEGPFYDIGYPDSRLGYVQRSRVFGFPDLITVETIAQGPERATLAIYSRSVYGYSDWGVNRARIERWLQALEPFEEP